jgi:nicotine blue oxidoreductase
VLWVTHAAATEESQLSKVAGLVLAAGGGRRYGGPKALVSYEGRLLVERAVETVRDGGCAPVVVVLGAAVDEVRARASIPDVVVAENRAWRSGMGSSLRVGLEALVPLDVVAAVVVLVDMPGISAEAVSRLAALADPAALATASYDEGRRGHPVLIGRDHWSGVATLAMGDVGARPYLSARAGQVQVVPCGDVADDADLDVPPEGETIGRHRRPE